MVCASSRASVAGAKPGHAPRRPLLFLFLGIAGEGRPWPNKRINIAARALLDGFFCLKQKPFSDKQVAGKQYQRKGVYAMDWFVTIIVAVATAALGAAGGYLYRKQAGEKKIGRTEEYARNLLEDAQRKADE